MSMHTHVVGIKLPDEKWCKMKAVYDACQAAGVPTPALVDAYFGDLKPDEVGVVLDLVELAPGCCSPWAEGSKEGFEIRLKLLPPDVAVIRFFNSW